MNTPTTDQARARRRLRRAVMAVIGAVCLAVGLWLIADYLRSTPPDPATAQVDRLIAFVMSDRFNRLTDEQRRAYAEAMVQRYAEMTEEQRKAAERQMAAYREANPQQMREQMMRFWKDYMVREAELYVELPPDQREAHLRARLASWSAMFGGPPPDDERRREREQRWDQIMTPQRQARAVEFFQTEVLPRTSARDRALTAIMFRDIAAIMDRPPP